MKRRTLNAIIALVVLAMAAALLVPLALEMKGNLQEQQQLLCSHEKTNQVLLETDNKMHTYKVTCLECNSVVTEALEEKHDWSSNSKCKVCDYKCDHDYVEGIRALDSSGHVQVRTCRYCSHEIEITGAHRFVNQVCSVCKYACTHSNMVAISFEKYNSDQHNTTFVCACGYTVVERMSHNWGPGYDSVCDDCGQECSHNPIGGFCAICLAPLTDQSSCTHPVSNQHKVYEYHNNSYHKEITRCSACGEKLDEGTLCPHDLYGDGYCDDCDYTCDHSCGGIAGYCALCQAPLT